MCLYTCCESQLLRDQYNVDRWYKEIRSECLDIVGISKNKLAREAQSTGVLTFIVDAPLDRITPEQLNTFTNELSRHIGWNPLTVDAPTLRGVMKNGVADAWTEVTVRIISDSTAHAKEYVEEAIESGLVDSLRTSLPIMKMEAPDVYSACPGFNFEECTSTAFWNLKVSECHCQKSLSALGVFFVVILPIIIGLSLIYVTCLYSPMCPFYKGPESELQKSVRKGSYREAASQEEYDMGGGGMEKRKGSILQGLASDADPGQYDSIAMDEVGEGGIAQDFRDIDINVEEDGTTEQDTTTVEGAQKEGGAGVTTV